MEENATSATYTIAEDLLGIIPGGEGTIYESVITIAGISIIPALAIGMTHLIRKSVRRIG